MRIAIRFIQFFCAFSLPLVAAAPARAEQDGVTYHSFITTTTSDLELWNNNDIEVHVVSIDRSRSDYELRVVGVEGPPGFLLTTPLPEMLDVDTIAAINGYEWANDGTDESEDADNYPVRPDATLILGGEVVRDCFSAISVAEMNAAGCKNDKNVLGIADGMNFRMFNSKEFRDPDNAPYHKFAIGSDRDLIRDGVCIASGSPPGWDSRSAIGFNNETLFLVSTDVVGPLAPGFSGLNNAADGDLCQIMLDLGATEGMVLDGGTSAGLIVFGELKNPLDFLSDLWFGGPSRPIANAIALVKKAPGPDPGPEPDPDEPCPSGDGLYCGDSVGLDEGVLYSCADGVYEEVMMCADGCTTAAPGENDYCGAGESCPSGDGLYCGGSVGLDADVLYACSGGMFTESQTCVDGCEVAPPGENDYCAGAPCDCTSGECCDGCHFRPSSHVCDPGVDESYGCIGSGCGSDVSVSVRDRLCSGFSAGCDGGYSAWSSAELYAECSSDEECTDGSQSCSASQSCTQCTDSYEVTNHACSDFTSANNVNQEIFEVCGSVDEQTGYMTVRARKYDGSTFGDRPYQVRVSPPGDPSCGPDTWFYYESDDSPSGVGTDELVFTFQSVWEEDQTSKGYCVTASTKAGDMDYDPNSDAQTSWWWSDKLTLTRTCVP